MSGLDEPPRYTTLVPTHTPEGPDEREHTMATKREYMDEWPLPQVLIRLAFFATALIGLWVSAAQDSLRWEIIFAAYFIVQNVEHATAKILFELRRGR